MLWSRRKHSVPSNSSGGLSLNAISKRYKGSATPALDRVSLKVAAGKTTAVLGESGSGKTTLLRLVAGFEELEGGSIDLGELRVADEKHSLPPEERSVGVVFQDTALLPHLTIRQNISFGLRGMTETERLRHVDAIVNLVRVRDAQHRFPHEVSGGQAQRAAIARALAAQPRVLLLDEPFNNLDGPLKAQLIDELRTILSHGTTSAIFVTHDRDEAFNIADRVAVIRAGRLQQEGTPEQLYWAPKNVFVAGILGKTNLIKVRRTTEGWVSDFGPMGVVQPLEIAGQYVASIRPSQLCVSDTPSNSANMHGTVLTERFLGEVRELTIRMNSEGTSVRLTAHASAASQFNSGDRVFVSLSS